MIKGIFNGVTTNKSNKSKNEMSIIKNNDVNIYQKNDLDDYPYIKEFKRQKLEFRIQTSDKILLKYQQRVPIIVECKKGIEIDKNKFVIPKNLTIGQALYVIKKRINIQPQQAIFLICNNSLLMNTDTIENVYNKYKDEDGFLYIFITLENTFGNND